MADPATLLTSSRRARRRCWLEVCTGAEKGRSVWWSAGDISLRSAALSNRPVCALAVWGAAAETLFSPAAYASQSACVCAEPSLFCKVSVRLRGEENDPRAWCRGGHRWGWGLPG